MKKLIYVTLALIAMFSVSCSKSEEATDPTDLTGTTWKCSTFGDAEQATLFDYYQLNFTSKTAVNVTIKLKAAPVAGTMAYSYTLTGSTVALSMGDMGNLTGTISGNTMTFAEDQMVFTKQ